MESMFENCHKLSEIKIDNNNFITKKVDSMKNMFKGCSELTSFDFSKFDTSEVSNMDGMFSGAICIKKLDLSSFDTRKVKSCEGMWDNINELDIKIDVSKNSKILKNKPKEINVTDINNIS